MESDT